MAVGGVDVIVGIAAEAVGVQVRREPRAGQIHRAPDPDGIAATPGDHQDLRDVERPAVVAGEVVDVGGIGADEHVEVLVRHRAHALG